MNWIDPWTDDGLPELAQFERASGIDGTRIDQDRS
jgi:hypothetical protein